MPTYHPRHNTCYTASSHQLWPAERVHLSLRLVDEVVAMGFLMEVLSVTPSAPLEQPQHALVSECQQRVVCTDLAHGSSIVRVGAALRLCRLHIEAMTNVTEQWQN